MDNFNLAEEFNLGAYLYHRQLSIIPGTFSETINGCVSLITVECTPFVQPVHGRLKMTFYTFKEINLAGGYHTLLSYMNEERLPGNTPYLSEAAFSANTVFET